MRRLAKRLTRPGSMLLLPLSLVPLFLTVPGIVQSHENFRRLHHSGPLATPLVELSAKQQARFQPVARYADAIPVIAYRGITESAPSDQLDVSQARFAEQLAALRHMGFRSVSMDQYIRFRQGDGAGLPERPILITFDGGRLDSYRGADKVLQRYGFRATMFVASGAVEAGDHDYLTWDELRRMANSGRWDVEPAAHNADERVVVDAAGDKAPAYSSLRYTRSTGVETAAAFEERVSLDVFAAKDSLAAHGFDTRAFSVPAGDDGGQQLVADLLSRQFAVSFVRDPRNDPSYTRPTGDATAFGVNASITTDRLYMWLRDNAPTSGKETSADVRNRWLHGG
jgi:peptidoglycan/xylan/chitin deacetylase (PgdA/CDA1 family)